MHRDEMLSLVRKKADKAWIRLARDAGMGRIVGMHVGDRSAAGATALWEGLPPAYRGRALCLSDHWEAYAAAIPAPHHLAASKRSGLMNGIERFNNTVRQRLGRMTRKTLSFSKSWENHVGCLKYFIEDYNRELPLLT